MLKQRKYNHISVVSDGSDTMAEFSLGGKAIFWVIAFVDSAGVGTSLVVSTLVSNSAVRYFWVGDDTSKREK